jgi:hypothetical protein
MKDAKKNLENLKASIAVPAGKQYTPPWSALFVLDSNAFALFFIRRCIDIFLGRHYCLRSLNDSEYIQVIEKTVISIFITICLGIGIMERWGIKTEKIFYK